MLVLRFFTFIYAIIVFLSGFMSFIYNDHFLGLWLEGILAITLFIDLFWMDKKRKTPDIIAFVISLTLIIFYGIYFSRTSAYLFGVLAGISFFMTLFYLGKITNMLRRFLR